MEQAVYTIRTITNLHMGDIGSAVNIIDKSVQKDAVTEYPTIYATSLKGALRNAAALYNAAQTQNEEKINLQNVFGDTNADGAWKGKYRFNDAHLLFYPIRSDRRPYYLAVSPMLLEQALQIMEIAGNECAIKIIKAFKDKEQRETDKLYVGGVTKNVLVGNISVGVNENDDAVKNLLGLFNIENEPGLLYLSDQEMSEHLEQLPVIARNQLNNGISANLWYEEFVPRKTVFLTLISRECEDTGFDKMLKEPFQMGANATVGYGLSVMQKVKAGGNQA